MSLFFAALPLIAVVALVLMRPYMHKWKYPANGNPWRRTCKVCGRHEQAYTRGHGFWWESHGDGRPGHKCSEVQHERAE